jgi:adenine-specific DNA-methyltransferase
MRYIGSKTATLPAIQSIIQSHAPWAMSLCDPFAGTCTVARHFKNLGMRVETGDMLWGSYMFQLATIALNETPAFARLTDHLKLDLDHPNAPSPALAVLSFLERLPGEEGFVTAGFSDARPNGRRFFIPANALKIDSMRNRIAEWRTGSLIDELEEGYLIACLLDAADRVANTAGTYMAHLKTWGRKALKPLEMRAIPVVNNGAPNRCSRADARSTASTEVDVLYLDPPYNERDYSFYYHLPESLVLWDGLAPTGKSGVPGSRRHPMSDFCRQRRAAAALDELLAQSRARFTVIHYASDGLIRHEEILEVLEVRGKVQFSDLEVRSYSSKVYTGSAKAHHRIYWCHSH